MTMDPKVAEVVKADMRAVVFHPGYLVGDSGLRYDEPEPDLKEIPGFVHTPSAATNPDGTFKEQAPFVQPVLWPGFAQSGGY